MTIPVPPLKTTGIALDANGDVWDYRGAEGLVKIASAGGNGGNGGGPMSVSYGDPVVIAIDATVPAGFYMLGASTSAQLRQTFPGGGSVDVISGQPGAFHVSDGNTVVIYGPITLVPINLG